MAGEETDSEEVAEALDEVAETPSVSSDPQSLVEDALPAAVLNKFRAASYRKAASILKYGLAAEFSEILEALEAFEITTDMIRRPGGNESDIPKAISGLLRHKGWYETTISGDLHIKREWRQIIGHTKSGKPITGKSSSTYLREKFLDGHKIDYVKNRLAFDFEWNSKDQTFDRDLYAFAAFAEAGAIDAAVIVTRDTSLNDVFRELGQALDKNGQPLFKDGQPVPILPKYGASTTWWGKLIYRLNAGRNGGCPVLALGIKAECISDLAAWRASHSAASTPEL